MSLFLFYYLLYLVFSDSTDSSGNLHIKNSLGRIKWDHVTYHFLYFMSSLKKIFASCSYFYLDKNLFLSVAQIFHYWTSLSYNDLRAHVNIWSTKWGCPIKIYFNLFLSQICLILKWLKYMGIHWLNHRHIYSIHTLIKDIKCLRFVNQFPLFNLFHLCLLYLSVFDRFIVR